MSLNQNTKGVEFLKRLGIKDTREFGTVYRAWINKVVETREPDEKYIGYKIYGQEGHVVLIFGGTDKTGGEGTMLTFEMEGDAHDYETFGDGLKPIIESGIYYGKGGGVKQNEPSMPDAPIDPTFDADADLPAPDEENLVIKELRTGFSVVHGDKVIKKFARGYNGYQGDDAFADAMALVNAWRKENNLYLPIYYMNASGSYWLIDEDGNAINKFEEGGSVGELKEQNPQNQTPYVPKSASCTSLQTITPENMAYDIHKAVAKIDGLVGGVDNYVAEKLGYTVGKCSAAEREAGKECLCNAFSGEQIDAIALAIYNIETKGQGVIIGDQAGIGKGRTAAGMIRYAINKGVMPIFLTIKPTLFSDIYRDLIDIDGDEGIPLRIFTGNKTVERKTIKTEEEIEEADDADVALQEEETEYVEVPTYKTNTEYPKYTYTAKDENGNERKVTKTGNKRIVPFIVNGGGAKTKIKDMDGNILYEGSNEEVKKVIGSLTKRGTYNIPKEYNVILATYSQFGRISAKMNFIEKYAKGAIVIMDESHQASGSSATGEFLRNAIKESLGTVFLSATFAKRPDNMPVYASKTALQDTSLDDDGLIGAINSGGVALQEVISSQLSGEAQMVRRERSYEGIEVNYMYLDESQAKRGYPEMNKEMEHRIIFDSTTDIIRKIIKFQDEYVNERIEFLDKELAGEMKEAGQAAQQIKAGVDNVPSFSGIFNIINQLLFSLKADSVAEHAIQRIKEGKQVLIAFGSTMESFLNNLVVDGKNAEVGDTIKADFSLILERRLDSVLRYRIKDQNGNITRMKMELDELSIGAQMEYKAIMNDINKLALGIKLSPIDVLIEKITAAGFKVKEVTGRNKRLSYIDNGENAIIETIRKQPVNDMLREFNNNEIHCLLLNQSGATGISAHAVPTKNVPRDQVKQRCMVILQPELDVNTEVQKRGRIYRTGQIKTPIYDYVISAVPAEKRLMMMLQKKLKSLSANTSASQKDADKTIVSDDFLNKYGDRIVQEYLKNSKTINMLLGDPLKLNKEGNKEESEVEDVFPNAAQKASGRVAILSIKDQEDFYDNITGTYQGEIKYLNEIGQNDLVVKDLNFEAETKSREIAIAGQGKLTSVFGRHSILEKCDVNNLRKPLTRKELDKFVSVALGGRDADDISADLIKKYNAYVENRRAIDMSYEEEVYKLKLKNRQEMKDWAALTDDKKRAVQEALREEMEQRKETDNEDWDDRLKRFEKSVRFFTIGQGYAYPFSAGQTSESSFFSKAVFLGFSIDEKKKNPYAPSSVEMKFAIADSRRIVSLPMSKSDVIAMIRGLSDNNRWELRDVYAEWDSLIKDSMALRTTRYIVTGNILQAFGKDEFKAGSLVSYTLKGGGRKKGILLPDSFKPEGSGQRGDEDMKVDVPINQVIDKLILKMEDGSALYFKNGNMLLRDHDKYGGSDSYRFSVPASKQAGGEYYLNKTILSEFISGNDFNKRGSQMEGVIKSDKIERFCLYLWDKYKASVSISRAKFEALFGSDLDMDYSEEDIERNRQVFDMALREAQARRKAELEATAGEQRMKEETERLEKEQKEREGRLSGKLAYQEATGVLLHLQELLLEDAIVAMRKGGMLHAIEQLNRKQPETYVLVTREFKEPVYIASLKDLKIQITDKESEAEKWSYADTITSGKLAYYQRITGYNGLQFEVLKNKKIN